MPKSKKKGSKKETSTQGVDEKKSESCIICEREMEADGYCKYHNSAYHNLMEAYDNWEEAYGELSFLEYLKKLVENSATGIWAKEVAEILLKEEASEE